MRRSLPPLELRPCAGGRGPGAGPSPHPPGPRPSLARQGSSRPRAAEEPTGGPEGGRPSPRAGPPLRPPASVLAGSPLASGTAATTTTISPTLATCSGHRKWVRAAASLARRTLPDDRVPKRPGTARASCRPGGSALGGPCQHLLPRHAGDTGLPDHRGTHFSWNWRNPGLTWGLAFSREVVAKGEVGR